MASKTPRERSAAAQAQARRKSHSLVSGDKAAQPGWRPATYRVKRGYAFLNFNPPRGNYCIATAGSYGHEFKPLICHASFMDALYDENIPVTQGVTRKNDPRQISCRGKQITGTDRVPYERSDKLPIFEVSQCTNHTKKQAWLGGQWTEVSESDLASLSRDGGLKWSTFLLPAGLLFAVMAASK